MLVNSSSAVWKKGKGSNGNKVNCYALLFLCDESFVIESGCVCVSVCTCAAPLDSCWARAQHFL